MSDQGHFKNKSRTARAKRFQYKWFDGNPAWKTWVKEVPNEPTKYFCKACKTTLTCGLTEIKKHSGAEIHLRNMMTAQNLDCNISDSKITDSTFSAGTNSEQAEMAQPGSEEDFNFEDRVKMAEIRLSVFFVEKNVPFAISSDLLLLMKDIGKEPGILKSMYLGRTKLTHIVNNVLCRQVTNRISTILKENKFSVYEEKILNVMNEKWFPLMVRYVEPKTLRIKCELLQMIHLGAINSSASKIFQSFKTELLKKNIPLQSIVSLVSYNISTVNKNSFETKLIENNPDLVALPCVCHYSALAVKVACKVLPQNCRRFIKSVSTIINNSPEKIDTSQDSNMSSEKSSYAAVGWLSRHKYIEGILEVWDTLDNFLTKQACKDISADLHSIFQDPATKAYVIFLKFTLDTFKRYNDKFQTQETVIHELQPSSMELLLWFLRKFIKSALLNSEIFDHTVRNLIFSDPVNQLPLEEIDFGDECKQYLQDRLNQGVLSETDVKLVQGCCLQFYVKASEYICNHLPIDNLFLQHVNVFASRSALYDCDRDSTFRKVLQVKRRLRDMLDEDSIESEWRSLYEISPIIKDELSKLSFDDMWMKISLFSTDEGKLCFPNLRSLLSVVRTIPHSNTEAKRVYSLIPETSKKKRNLSIETLNSICVINYYLRSTNETARTMTMTREHLDLTNSANVYKIKSE
ncbi:PREDICTED: uncharacterized protein LOC106743939 [Dinoponera quadriceps]|uniref:Uncharacterized protein LOC106743939 n=1 Tax=Dinoponera quadriceps TaxID=609295 RepID=A0A6P3X6A2_DINQU|nr:PREDICTED: uncharacterized protein LOC106743939 [Dinoponera quadriceps]XP_014473780.1 PREDICTED: uncharacterized protein LOC106743939 [Dinoponera quadriceps]